MSPRPATPRLYDARAVGAFRESFAQEVTRGVRETPAPRASASAVLAAGAGTISGSAQFTTRRRASPSTPARRWAPVASHLVSAAGASQCGEETGTASARCLNDDSRAGSKCCSAHNPGPGIPRWLGFLFSSLETWKRGIANSRMHCSSDSAVLRARVKSSIFCA
jgi:hypothetical protein